ncbi:peptidase inhibitor family I36 protein [Actinokineospora sp. G85]|uniref:peptidase inhibitor family I36 protein n=1 Tax=Actinokineospora sp. G85 TaxID=3406626 RepID=UPI003C76FDDE
MRNHTRVLLAALFATLAGLLGAGVAAASGVDCARGEVCFWTGSSFRGAVYKHSLADTNPEECVPLPSAVDVVSFVNRMDRHVTVYQSRECATEGDFSTYPGGGSYVPEAPYLVRAFQIW